MLERKWPVFFTKAGSFNIGSIVHDNDFKIFETLRDKALQRLTQQCGTVESRDYNRSAKPTLECHENSLWTLYINLES